MIELKQDTVELIRAELASIPEKYHNFRNVHEGLGVLREEYRELEDEMFFGERLAKNDPHIDFDYERIWRERIRKEAVQVAAMAIRIIQELT